MPAKFASYTTKKNNIHNFISWCSPLFRNIGWFRGLRTGLTHVCNGAHPIFHRPNPFRPPLPGRLVWPLASLALPTFNAEHD